MKPTTIKRILAPFLVVLVMGVTGLTNLSSAAGGVKIVYKAKCDGPLSLISIKVSVYEHPFDFALGDSFGYGLFYDAPEGRTFALYDNGFLEHDARGSVPAPYVGWRYEDSKYSGPMGTYDFAPLPSASDTRRIRVFEVPTRAYDYSRPGPNRDFPPFMNIFLDPSEFPERYFSIVADCLAARRQDINHVLAMLDSEFPQWDRTFYQPLRLGGIVLGLPPYGDEKYLELIRSVWGDTQNEKAIPPYGFLTVGVGQTAKGIIEGRWVEISLGDAGEPKVQVDGNVSSPPSYIGDSVCQDDLQRCGKSIDWIKRNDDGSLTFMIGLKTGPRAYSDRPRPRK